jgi:hypothetical protein
MTGKEFSLLTAGISLGVALVALALSIATAFLSL